MRYLFFITNYLLTIQNACRGLFWFNSEKTRTPLSFVTETYVLSFLKITIVLFLPFFLLQNTFHYDNAFWSNKETFNLSGGKTGFDDHETKLPTYWNTSFSKICLGMKINNQINFIEITESASSLFSLIADGKYRNTSLGRDKWKSLIGSEASLQHNCNKEGFNAVGRNPLLSKARIGILGNEQDDCFTCDSRIGFGTGGKHDNNNTCGNEARHGGDNGNKHIKVMGYILVQWQENTTEENLLKFFLHHDHTL